MLKHQDLNVLERKLKVPLIIEDILNGQGALTDDVKYGLHEAISEMQPDTCLLSVALSALKITEIYDKASPSTKVMKLETRRIINEYGFIWLQNAIGGPLGKNEVYDVLIHTAEDLESLADLLELTGSFLRAKDETAAKICDILYIQARSHAMIADAYMLTADQKAKAKPLYSELPIPAIAEDNVIPFPLAQRGE